MKTAILGLVRAALLSLLLVFPACSARIPAKANTVSAAYVLDKAALIRSVAVVEIESQDTLYRFNAAQVDSLKSALKASFVSESLLLTPPPWPIALVMKAEKGPVLVALHYGDVLRVNAGDPWSPILADSAGNSPIKGIADIVLDGDDVPWISALLQRAVGQPPSKPHRAPKVPRLLDIH